MSNAKSKKPHHILKQVKIIPQNWMNKTAKFDKKWEDIGGEDSIQKKLYRCVTKTDIQKYENEHPGILKQAAVDGVTLLHLAARQGKQRIDIIPELLKHVDINAQSKDGYTPLHYAIHEFSDPQAINILIENKANVNARTNKGETALHLLVPYIIKQTQVLNALIDSGIDVNAADNKGETVAHYLARHATTDLNIYGVRFLKDIKLNINVTDAEGCTPLHRSIENQNVSFMKTLVQDFKANIAEPNTKKRTPLHFAMQYLNDAVNEDRRFADPNIEAVLKNFRSNMPNDLHDVVLSEAIKWGKFNFVKYLLNDKVNIARLLHLAVEQNNEEIVHFLFSKQSSVSVNELDDDGKTPLHYAVNKGLVNMIELLINKGADLTIKTKKDGWTVAHLAVATGNLDVWETLLRHEDKMEPLNQIKDEKHYNLLEYGMLKNDPTIVEFLLAMDMKASLLDKDGNLRNFSSVVLELALDNCMKVKDTKVYADFSQIITSNAADLREGTTNMDATQCNTSTRYNSDNHDIKLDETIHSLSQSKNCDTLLRHPAIKTYIKWKWSEVAPIYYVNLISYLIVCLFVCYVSVTEADISPLYLTILIAFSLALAIKEGLQCYANYKEYVKSIDNYIEVGVITVIVLTMSDLELEHRKRVSAVAYILIGVSLTLMLGKHPKASTSIQLLKTVTYQFFKYFPIYILIIPSFALSFYHLFSESGMSILAKNADDSSNLFDTSLILLQTMIMILGNFSVDNLDDKHYNFISMTILIMFLIFISIILVNLLNGLAVSNILGKEELKKSKYRSQIDYLYNTNKSLRSLKQIFKGMIFKSTRKSIDRIHIYPHHYSYKYTFDDNDKNNNSGINSNEQSSPDQKSDDEYAYICSRRIHQEVIAIDKKKVNRSTEYRLIVLDKQLTNVTTAVAHNKSEITKQISDMQKEVIDEVFKRFDELSAQLKQMERYETSSLKTKLNKF